MQKCPRAALLCILYKGWRDQEGAYKPAETPPKISLPWAGSQRDVSLDASVSLLLSKACHHPYPHCGSSTTTLPISFPPSSQPPSWSHSAAALTAIPAILVSLS